MTVLLIKDDVEFAASLAGSLRESGYIVHSVYDGESGLVAVQNCEYEVIILDRTLPGISGVEFVRLLRTESRTTPVLFLPAARPANDGRGCAEGGESRLQPAAFSELLARIRVLARRHITSGTRLLAGSVEVDLLRHCASRAGRPVDLSPQEFRLLEYLVRHADRVVTRKMLLEHVWNIHFDPHTSVVESHISRLRARLNQGFESDAIQTIRGVGYKIVAAT